MRVLGDLFDRAIQPGQEHFGSPLTALRVPIGGGFSFLQRGGVDSKRSAAHRSSRLRRRRLATCHESGTAPLSTS